jgi:putative DNA primase/helicase
MKRCVSEILDKLDGWRVEGGGVIGVCPAHADSHPSLRIDVNERGQLLLYCRAGCEYREVVDALGVDMRGEWSFPDGVDAVAVGAAVERVSENRLSELGQFVEEAVTQLHDGSEGATEALAYCRDRFGLSDEDVRVLGLGFTPARSTEWEPVKRSWNAVPRLVVPFRDFGGCPVGAQARALEDHEIRWTGLANDDGRVWSRFGAFMRDDGSDYVVVTEGPSDGLSAYGAGFSAVVVRGAALSKSQELLDQFAGELADRVVVVAGDADAAGESFRDGLVRALEDRGVTARPLLLPDGVNDLNDWRMADPSVFAAELARAVRAVSGAAIAAAPTWDRFTGQAPSTHATAAEAVLWWMRETGRDAVYVRGYGTVVFDAGMWWPGHEHRFRTVLHEAGREARESTDQQWWTFGNKLGSRGFLDAMTREFEAILPEIQADDLDAREDLLLVANGVVNLRTGELMEPRPSMFLSQRVPVRYDPSASAPRWERFVEEVMSEDAEMAAFMKRLTGYGVTGSTAEQCFAIFHGTGANGKSIFMDALTAVFGPVTKTVPFSVFENSGHGGGGPSPELARLRGARLTLTSEGEHGAPIREALVKSLTGGDTITARHLYREEMEFQPRHLILMASNYKPRFLGSDEGLWRRVKLIPFARFFRPEERDHYLSQTLRGEAEGILRWAVEGAVEWYAGGLQDPALVREATEEYRDDSDMLMGFFPGRLVEDDNEETLKAVFDAWEDHAERIGETAYNSRWLGTQLENRGLKKVRRNSGMMVLGVRLVSEAEFEGMYQ